MPRLTQSPAPEGLDACLSDEVLFAFATGSTGPLGRARAESHLADCADCRAVLVQAVSGTHDEPGRGARAKRIGRYELLELLGAGSAGVVYRAFDTELERVVAIKVLVAGAAQATFQRKERILGEARAMAQLSHPNVVTVFDVGVSDGAVFIVMEYVPGTTLERWLRAPERTPDEVVTAFLAAGRGLLAAHAKRIAHRDFKSENVLVSREGQVRVTDFGLARSLDSAEPGVLASLRDSDVSTRTRGIFGTPAYMAPELFDGSAADAASDQFSYSVALLAALLGRHPFGADEGIPMSELVTRIREQRVDCSGKTVPPALREVLLRGVLAEPAARYADMEALLLALERAQGPLARPRRLVRTTFLVAAGALVLAAASTVFFAPRAGATPARLRGALAAFDRVMSRASESIRHDGDASPALSVSVPVTQGLERLPSAREAARRVTPARARVKQREAVRYHDSLRDPF
ncbi:MAG TPA: serine/threonine-protein kinase [Polyangiaceae bacterium]